MREIVEGLLNVLMLAWMLASTACLFYLLEQVMLPVGDEAHRVPLKGWVMAGVEGWLVLGWLGKMG